MTKEGFGSTLEKIPLGICSRYMRYDIARH